MKILSIDKDKVQVELTNKEFNRWMGICLINAHGVAFTGSAVIIEYDMPNFQQTIYTKGKFNRVVNSIKERIN